MSVNNQASEINQVGCINQADISEQADDISAVTKLLGRPPECAFEVVVREVNGVPVVIRNAPFLRQGRPMPTLYWLVGSTHCRQVAKLESQGGVRTAEAAVDEEALAAAHARYASERDAYIPADHEGPVPSGGVGGTMRGVKCLHAHYAWYLAGGEDPVGRWVAQQLSTAVIDCGTNSTRMLITDATGENTLERRFTLTRLGEGVNASGALKPAAIERTLACLRGYKRVMDRYMISSVRAVSTSAVRDSDNRSDFLNAASSLVGKEFECLPGDEEARLAFQGAVSDLRPSDGPFLVVDIGGGSTELSYGVNKCESSVSLNLGSVRLTEQYMHHDPPLAEELSSCLSIIKLHLDDAVQHLNSQASTFSNALAEKQLQMVGVAGTVTTAASVEIGLDTYDRDRIHHFRMTKAAVEDVFRTLAVEPLSDRVHNPGLEHDRADVIVAGVCILIGIMRFFGFEECLVSECDLLDGLIQSVTGSQSVSG